MKDNHGFTLIELIVVMVIMGIITVGSITGYQLLNKGSAQSTTERISSILDYVQLLNMKKNKNYYMLIEKKSGVYKISVMSESVPNDRTELEEELKLRSGGEITFQYNGDLNDYLISDTPVAGRNVKKLEVCFSKDSGGFIPNGLDGGIANRIKITDSKSSYTIRLVEITGKHYIE